MAVSSTPEALLQCCRNTSNGSSEESSQQHQRALDIRVETKQARIAEPVSQGAEQCADSSLAEKDEPTITVSATNMGGNQATILVSATAKVSRIKEQLAPCFCMQPDQLRLLHGFDSLEDDSVLSELFETDKISLGVLVVMPLEVSQRVKELSDIKSTVRSNAAQVLGMMGEKAWPAVPYLECALEDENEDVQVRAAESIGMFGEPAACCVPALNAALERMRKHAKEESSNILPIIGESPGRFIVSILDALSKIGKPGIPVLRHALTFKPLRTAAASALARAGEAAAPAVPELLVALKDSGPQVRKKCAESIVCIGKAALPALEEMLEHSDDTVSGMAATALGNFGLSALPLLQRAMTSSSPRIRKAAADALGQTEALDSMNILQKALCDADLAVSATVVDSLGKLGDTALPALEQALSIDYWAVHTRLVEIFEGLGGAAILLLEQMMRECSVPVRIQAIEALGRLVSADEFPSQLASVSLLPLEESKANDSVISRIVATLASLLDDMVPCMRQRAARTLGIMGPLSESAAPALAAVLLREHQFEEVRQEAAQALASIGVAAISRLECVLLSCVGTLDCGSCMAAEIYTARRAARLAVGALGKIGDAAVPALVRVLNMPELHYIHVDAVTALTTAAGLLPVGHTITFSPASKKNEKVRHGAVTVATKALPILAKLLTESNAWLRWEVVDVLASIRGVECAPLAVPPLINALGDVFVGIRVSAAVALGKHGVAATSALPALEAAGQHAACEGDTELCDACRAAIDAIHASSMRSAAIVFRRRVLNTAAVRWAES